MTRIKINDLPQNKKVSREEMRRIVGGASMDQIMEMATSNKFYPHELLAPQTGMHRYTNEIERVTKITEKTTNGVDTISQSQV